MENGKAAGGQPAHSNGFQRELAHPLPAESHVTFLTVSQLTLFVTFVHTLNIFKSIKAWLSTAGFGAGNP